jgi:hypothetical protein
MSVDDHLLLLIERHVIMTIFTIIFYFESLLFFSFSFDGEITNRINYTGLDSHFKSHSKTPWIAWLLLMMVRSAPSYYIVQTAPAARFEKRRHTVFC